MRLCAWFRSPCRHLHDLGIADTRENFLVVSEGHLNRDGIPVVVLAKRSAFTVQEDAQVRAHVAANPNLFLLYSPFDQNQLPPDPHEDAPAGPKAFPRLIQLNDPHRFAAGYPYASPQSPTTLPSFFFNLKPAQFFRPGILRQGMDWKINLGVAVLGMVLIISLLAVLLFLIVPLGLGGHGRQQRPSRLLYFVAVGLGYILVEIAFIQRFVLFLGHPVYALTVVVFLLLVSSGAGSMLCRRWLANTRQIWLPLILVAAVLLLYVAILPALLNRLVGLPFGVKLLVSAGLLIPLGFGMGMPFPTGLRALAGSEATSFPSQPENQGNLVEWAWAMNAASSVLGSVVAIVVAIQFGLNTTLACGAAAYLLALCLLSTLNPAVQVR